jgi:F0F1-type ATP synthase membrane subunit b/b'
LQQLNDENAKKAQELAARIADAEKEYREKTLQADEEIRVLKAKAKKEIEALKETIIAKGKAEGDRIVTQALNARDEIRAEIEEQMHEKAVEISRRIFAKVLGSDEQKLVHDGLLDNVIQELRQIDQDRLKDVDLQGESKGKAEVKTPHPLTAQQKEQLETVLSSRLGKKITVEEAIEKDIIAGIIIALGSFVIDGSFSARFAKAAAGIK